MDSMEIDDNVYIDRNLTMEGLIPRGEFQRRRQPSRCVSVCLGLLCAALLAGNIGQFVYYEITGRHSSADLMQASYNAQEQLQSSYDALTVERKQLEGRLSNLTKEKDQLQQSYSSLTTERDEFKVSLNKLKGEKDQLLQSYDTLKQESDHLQTSNDDMRRDLEGLRVNHVNLTASSAQLQADYSNLRQENRELQTVFRRLQGNYSTLKTDRDELQKSYATLNLSNNQLQISYSSLWTDKEQLQARYTTLRRDKEQLQANYSSVAAGRDRLQKKIDRVRRNMLCQTGWQKFDIGCYFVSTLKRNWTLSRQYCTARGADLVIIDSREEQVFVSNLLKSGANAWIGLTDSLKEGTWMWVDGSPVTTAYWQAGQPNSFNGNQDCGEILPVKSGIGEWNDDGCFAEQIWVCEK